SSSSPRVLLNSAVGWQYSVPRIVADWQTAHTSPGSVKKCRTPIRLPRLYSGLAEIRVEGFGSGGSGFGGSTSEGASSPASGVKREAAKITSTTAPSRIVVKIMRQAILDPFKRGMP